MMTYNKPEITKLASSLEAIQGQQKNETPLLDSVYPFTIQTSAAYQADE